MCYPVCGVVHIKEPLLLIGKSSHYSGGSGFFSIYNGPLPMTPYKNVFSVSLNKTFPSSFFLYSNGWNKKYLYGSTMRD